MRPHVSAQIHTAHQSILQYSPIRGERPVPGRPTCAQHSALSGSIPSRVLDETATFIVVTLPSVLILMTCSPSS